MDRLYGLYANNGGRVPITDLPANITLDALAVVFEAAKALGDSVGSGIHGATPDWRGSATAREERGTGLRSVWADREWETASSGLNFESWEINPRFF
jgi:hypothetical protein